MKNHQQRNEKWIYENDPVSQDIEKPGKQNANINLTDEQNTSHF